MRKEYQIHRLSENLYAYDYVEESVFYAFVSFPNSLKAMIDNRLIKFDQWLFQELGSFKINTWMDGREVDWRGLITSRNVKYRFESPHTFGRASTKKFDNYSTEEVISFLRKNKSKIAKFGVTRVSWNRAGITTAVGELTNIHFGYHDSAEIILVT